MTVSDEIIEKKDIKKRKLIFSGLGGTVGGPIFVIIGTAIMTAGAGTIISIILLGLLLITIVMNYSELALSLPILGGGYSFSKEAVGGFWGFMIGWLMWIGNITFSAVSGLSFGYSLSVFFPNRAGVEANYIPIIAFSVILIFSLLNLWARKFLQNLMYVFTMILLVGFAIYIIVSIFFGHVLNPENFEPSNLTYKVNIRTILAVSPLLIGVFCIYEWNSAYENITAKIHEIKQSQEKIPKSFMYAILIAIIIYFFVFSGTLLNIGEPGALTWDFIMASENPLADTAYMILGSPGLYLIGTAGMVCTMTSIQASMKMSYRLFYAMARDGYLPKTIMKRADWTKKSAVSGPAVVISCLIIMFLPFLFNVNDLVNISNFIILMTVSIISFTVILLRRERPNLARPYKVKPYPHIPIIAGVASIILGINIAPSALAIGIILVLFGVTIYAMKIARRDRILLLIAGAKIAVSLITIGFIVGLGKYTFLSITIMALAVFAVITVYFDLRPMSLIFRQIAKERDDNALIVSEMVEVDEESKDFIFKFNVVLGIIFIAGAALSLVYGWMIWEGLIGFGQTIFGVSTSTNNLVGTIVFGFNGIILLIAGVVILALQLEMKKAKI